MLMDGGDDRLRIFLYMFTLGLDEVLMLSELALFQGC